MRERPIIMSGESVRAILEGRKTQTRRVVTVPWVRGTKCRPEQTVGYDVAFGKLMYDDNPWTEVPCPFGRPGDLLWVREAWCHFPRTSPDGMGENLYYRADNDRETAKKVMDENGVKWRSSIHMPRWASRLTLRIKGVRVERVWEISPEDVEAEGLLGQKNGDFAFAWDALNAKRGYSWASNPWVWVISFEVAK